MRVLQTLCFVDSDELYRTFFHRLLKIQTYVESLNVIEARNKCSEGDPTISVCEVCCQINQFVDCNRVIGFELTLNINPSRANNPPQKFNQWLPRMYTHGSDHTRHFPEAINRAR